MTIIFAKALTCKKTINRSHATFNKKKKEEIKHRS